MGALEPLTDAGEALLRGAFARQAEVLADDLAVPDAQEQEGLTALCRLGLRRRVDADDAGIENKEGGKE